MKQVLRSTAISAGVIVLVVAGYLGLSIASLVIIKDVMLAAMVTDVIVAVAVLVWITRRALRPAPGTLDGSGWTKVVTVTTLCWLAGNATRVYLAAHHLDPQMEQRGRQFATLSPVLLLIYAMIIAPVAEEILMQGLLQGMLRRQMGPATAAGITALVFAGLHGTRSHLVYASMLGFVFALLYERTGRLWVPITAHILFNLSVIIPIQIGPWPGWVVWTGVAISIGALIWLWRSTTPREHTGHQSA